MARPANGLLHTNRDRSNKKAVLLLIVKDAYVEIVQRIASKLVVVSQGGVTAVEYGLIASLVALAIIAGVTLVGTKLNGLFAYVAGKVTTP